ncbi:MAG: hypothetical protein ACREQ2_12705 [Candidatus Binatia bacterium]
MERKKASDFDPQLLSLFHRYVHGGISRREFLDGAAKFAVGGLTATALWDMLRPNYALARGQRRQAYPGRVYDVSLAQGQLDERHDAGTARPPGERR